MSQDLKKILTDVKNADIPSAKRAEIEQNVHAMETDLEKMHDAAPDYKHRLQQALHLRFQALKQQVPHHEMNMEREKKDKVVSDLNKVADDVNHSTLSADAKASALGNIKQMKSNLEIMQTAKPEYKQRLSKAMKLRMDALKKQVVENPVAQHSSFENKIAHKVLKDLEGVLSQVHKSHPAHMSAIEDNIAAMKHDVTRLQDSHLKATDKKKLAKALSLRDRALEQQLADHSVESTHDDKVSKVGADLEKVLKDVHTSDDLSSKTKKAAEDNIHRMQEDLEKLDGADSQHKQRLQKALGLRMKALNQQISEDHKVPSVLSKTEQDLEKVKSEVKAAKMPAQQRTAVLDNISAMKNDLEKIGKADDATKHRLNKALGLRMSALKEQLAEQKAHKPVSSFGKVMADLEKVESEVSKRHSMSLSAQHEVKDNIHHMKMDLEKMQGAGKDRKQRLRKALGLRMNALKEKLGGK